MQHSLIGRWRGPWLAVWAALSLAACGERTPDAGSGPSADSGLEAAAEPLSAADYEAAAALLEGNARALVKNLQIDVHWLGDSGRFWYRRDTEAGHEWVMFDPAAGAKVPAFDHAALAAAINEALSPKTPLEPGRLALEQAALTEAQLTAALAEEEGKPRVACTLEPLACAADDASAPAKDLLVSPDGRFAAFARDDNLHLRDMESGEERPLTQDGAPWFSYGKWPDGTLVSIPRKKSDWPLPPYLSVWSPDGRYLVAPRIDERQLGFVPFVEWVPTDGSRRPVTHNLRSPLTGDREQMTADLFAFDVETGSSAQIQLPKGYEVAGLLEGAIHGWSFSRGQAFLAVADQGARSGGLLRVDLATGETDLVVQESASTRVEFNTLMYNRPNIRLLGDGDEAVWYSAESGWGHLYLHDAQTGERKNAITSGDWAVFDIHAVDEAARQIYFTAGGREAGRDPYYRHLYRAGLDGGEPVLLTPENADHLFRPDPVFMITLLFGIAPSEPQVRPDLGLAIDSYSTVGQPPVTVLRSTEDGEVLAELERADASALFAAGWQAPTRQAVKAADGETDIYTVYFAPNRPLPGGRHPVIDAVYGGPQVYVAPRNFVEVVLTSNPLGEASLARLGFAVAVTDGRGTPGRSNAYRDAGYNEFTQVGIDDHIAAIRQLAERYPEMDAERTGIYGWSWGGTFAGQAILSRPEFYDVSVSGAGVYDYAAVYPGFENMVGVPEYADGGPFRTRPDEYPANWASLDITALAGNLNGHLLIVYADMDENVPPAQAFRLIDALIKANKPYDLLALPNRAHAAGREGYVVQRTWDYFVEHLLDAEPPWDAEVTQLPAAPL